MTILRRREMVIGEWLQPMGLMWRTVAFAEDDAPRLTSGAPIWAEVEPASRPALTTLRFSLTPSRRLQAGQEEASRLAGKPALIGLIN
jgi:hypothetical protein